MRFRELVNFNEQSNMVTTIANVLQKGKETGQAIKSQQGQQGQQTTAVQAKPKSSTETSLTNQQTSSGTVGSQGSSNVSTQQPSQEKTTPAIQKPINIPTGTRIDPVVSTDPNVLKFKMDNAVFSLDTKDPQNNQLLQQLRSMGIKGQT